MTLQEPAMPKDQIRVLILPGADPVGDWVANVLNYAPDMAFLGLVRDLSQALEAIEKLKPDVILVDISSGILQRGDLINRVAAPSTGAAVIVMAMMGEVDMVRQAMLYGAQGFLLKPFSEAELLSSVRQAYELVVQRRSEWGLLARLMPGPEAAPAARAPIITVFSPKGGVGCTTLAINLAVALRMITDKTDKKVILVDADLRFGDIDAALNITSTSSIATVLPKLDQLDNQLLERSLASHSSGIKVLTAPPHLDVADSIRPEELKNLLNRLSELDDGFVVVDAWSTLDDCTLSLLDLCQYLVLVTTPLVTALRDTRRFLEVLKLLQFDFDKVILVLNHCYQRSTLQVKDVERALGYPIAQTLEYAPQPVTESLNRGVPLLQDYRDSLVARNILSLAQLIVDREKKRGDETSQRVTAPAKGEKPKRPGVLFQRQSTATGRVRG